MKRTKAAFAAISLVTAVSGNAGAAELHIEISGIAEAKGEVLVSLFNKAEGWLKKGVAVANKPAQSGTVSVSFPGLAEGEYAFSIVHDVNGNRKLDTNVVGMPVEPYGFSNNATGNFGPPTFEQAKFTLGPDKKVMTAKVQ